MAEPIGSGTRLERAPDALWRRVLDGVLVLAPDHDKPLHITAPGDVVWQLLADPITVDQLTNSLANLYATAENVVGADLEPVLEALVEIGAIRGVTAIG